MKRITMVKHHPCTQLAHLYEHMFLATAVEFMYQQGQYQLIDYMLDLRVNPDVDAKTHPYISTGLKVTIFT